MPAEEVEYAGFWVRVAAALIDTVLIVCITLPILFAVYGRAYFDRSSAGFFAGFAGFADFLVSWVAPAMAAILFWLVKQATPGKMLFSAKVVDAKTGKTMTVGQSIVRYLGYFVSTIPLGLGLLWVGLDRRKQGWHDKLAGTVVIRSEKRRPEPVRFDRT